MDERKNYADVDTVESQKENILPEEFPEGYYGAPDNRQLAKERTSIGERPTSAFTYEAKKFHEGLSRDYPDAHPTHDKKKSPIEEK